MRRRAGTRKMAACSGSDEPRLEGAMAALDAYDPPGLLTDFDAMTGQRKLWGAYIENRIDAAMDEVQVKLRALAATTGRAQTLQFYRGTAEEVEASTRVVDIVWNAFPRELVARLGRPRALVEADRVRPLAAYRLDWQYDPDLPLPLFDVLGPAARPLWSATLSYRPQTEYCEWHVDRNVTTGRPRRVCFSCEPPEYWMALSGSDPPRTALGFEGDMGRVLDLYRIHVSPAVQMDDLLVQAPLQTPLGAFGRGRYNPYNRWNSTHGVMHLTAPPNCLEAEIFAAAHATLRYRDARGAKVMAPELLTAGANLGNPNRASDPAIVARVNAMAREGLRVSVSNPVGLYIDHLDTAGWEIPGGLRIADCVRATRGSSNRICRLVVEMPTDEFDLGDLRIAGERLTQGGQIAECITMKMSVEARLGEVAIDNATLPLGATCRIDPTGGREIFVRERGDPPPAAVPAFEGLTGMPAMASLTTTRNSR